MRIHDQVLGRAYYLYKPGRHFPQLILQNALSGYYVFNHASRIRIGWIVQQEESVYVQELVLERLFRFREFLSEALRLVRVKDLDGSQDLSCPLAANVGRAGGQPFKASRGGEATTTR